MSFLLATGLRIGEALAVRWSDIDLEAGTVDIHGTVLRLR
ncbi:tyrosine-type recombinase/integrase [Microlunatus capsulatus]